MIMYYKSNKEVVVSGTEWMSGRVAENKVREDMRGALD